MTASTPTMSIPNAIVAIETMLGALHMNDLEVTRTGTTYTGTFAIEGSAARITLRLEATTATFHVEHQALLEDWQSDCIAHLAGCFCRALVSVGFRAAPPLPTSFVVPS